MFHEIKPWHLFGWLVAALILAAFILLQATGNILLIDIAMQLVFYVVVPGWFFAYHFKKNGIRLNQLVFLKGVSRWILPVFGLVLLSMAFSISAYWLILRALHSTAPFAVDLLFQPVPLPNEVWYLVSVAIIISIIAPISEEFVFRGLILTRLMARFGLWTGIGLSSLLFGIFHINFFGSFLFAVVASLLFLKTGNLLIPILLHMVNNTISVCMRFFNWTFLDWLTVTSTNDLYTKAWPNLIVLVISLALLIAIILRLSKDIEESGDDKFDFFKGSSHSKIDERPHDPYNDRSDSV